MIKNNLEKVRKSIKKMSKDKEISIIVVTKTVNIDIINKLKEYDVLSIAENRVQEIERKLELLDDKFELHLIGHLQSNKVNKVVGVVDLIQSVDSIKIAKRIDRRASIIGVKQKILLQFNISEETQKYGFDYQDRDNIINEVSKLNNLDIQGLMVMAPYHINPENSRKYFKKSKELFDYYKKEYYNKVSMNILSMGMSNDYLVAIEEGANMVRIGSAIFKEGE